MSISKSNGDAPFAVFEGTLDRRRVNELLSHESLGDRFKVIAVTGLIALVVIGVGWLLGRAKELPSGIVWFISLAIGAWIFGFGILHQYGPWRTRKWMKWNAILAGRYRIALHHDHVDVQTAQIATRVPYAKFATTDAGLSCVRLSFDGASYRALLLPLEDCRPPRELMEVKQFTKDRWRETRGQFFNQIEISTDDLPVPLQLPNNELRIECDGSLQQGELLDVRESTKVDNRRQVGIFLVLVVLATVTVFFIFEHERVNQPPIAPGPFRAWPQLIGGVVALVLTVYIKLRAKKAEKKALSKVRAEPNVEAGQLKGWVCRSGFGIDMRHGYVSVAWSACDAIEVTGERIVARFWKGDMMILGNHLFRTPSDFAQAAAWARAAANEGPDSAPA